MPMRPVTRAAAAHTYTHLTYIVVELLSQCTLSNRASYTMVNSQPCLTPNLQRSPAIGYVTLVAITGTIVLVPYIIKSLQLIWRASNHRRNLRVSYLHMKYSDFI